MLTNKKLAINLKKHLNIYAGMLSIYREDFIVGPDGETAQDLEDELRSLKEKMAIYEFIF